MSYIVKTVEHDLPLKDVYGNIRLLRSDKIIPGHLSGHSRGTLETLHVYIPEKDGEAWGSVFKEWERKVGHDLLFRKLDELLFKGLTLETARQEIDSWMCGM